MGRTDYVEISCKSALNRVQEMPFQWSLNPYRGCVHGCHYCYARATHRYFGLDADDDFVNKIIVKTNFAEILRGELPSLRLGDGTVALGTATDAYQPAEGRYRITRGVLEAFLTTPRPLRIVTKSTLILRDAELWVALAGMADVRVYFTITTLEPELAHLLEPGTPPPQQRLRIMRQLAEAGVPVGVLMAPVLPLITDQTATIAAVASATKAHGATSFAVSPLRLVPLVRDHYFAFLAARFPDLVARYRQNYQNANAPAAYTEAIAARADRIRRRYGFRADSPRRGADPSWDTSAARLASHQLALPLLSAKI